MERLMSVLEHSGEAEIELASAEALKADRKTAAFFREVFGSDAGKEVLARLDRFCYLKQTTFSPENRDLVIFREGMRNVALWVHTWLEHEREGETHGQKTEKR